jgi:hypothetical protein
MRMQGCYTSDPEALAEYPRAGIQVERIGDLVALDRSAFTPN